ncbi:MAG: STAS domain-containing protein [Spirochaetes bacterium]|jgi:anti-sigma B factor antagonist|nr:STAS domain-containing protein [Spirochaetota bacterium]
MNQPASAHVIVIDIEGKLNGETAVALEANLTSLLSSGKNQIILECSNLDFVTSGGISFLLSWTGKIKEAGGVLALVQVNKEIGSLFSVLKITRFLAIYPNKTDAVDAIKNSMFPHTSPAAFSAEDTAGIDESRIEITGESATDFASPLVIECSSCGALVRVYRPGDYICPGCKTEFHIKHDGTTVF